MRNYTLILCTALVTSLNLDTVANAQDLVNDGDIVVTARRTEERLQDVPVAITAFSSAAIQQRGVTDLRDFGSLAPGLTIAEANSPSTLILTIRGLANVNPLSGSDATVGFYLNDVPINLQSGTNLGMYDIGNVQVLKGPQGTLFGRNTTGGALLINTTRPSDRFEGYAQAGATFFRVGHGFQGEAAINVPLTPTLAVRLAGRLVDRDGFVRNILPRDLPDAAYGSAPLPFGRTNFKNLLSEKSEAGRITALWQPTAQIESTTVYDYAHMKGSGLPAFATALNPSGTIATLAPLLGFPDANAAYGTLVAAKKDYYWSTMAVAQGPLFVTTHTLSNTTAIEIGDNVTLKNIAGYRRVREEYAQEITGLPGPYLINWPLNKGYNFSNELQLSGKAMADRLSWVAGGFYFEEDRDYIANLVVFGGTGPTTDYNTRAKSYSLFGQGTFKLTDALSLTLGGRYNIDKRSARLSRFQADATGAIVSCGLAGGTVDNCLLADAKTFRAFTYTASIDYKVDSATLLYVTTRRGYRAGGFSNTQSTLNTGYLAFAPEKLTDYEVGFKRDWDVGSMKLRTNGAVFYQDYRDIQRLVVDPADFTNQLIVNARKAHVWGGELEVTLEPTPWLSLGYSYARVVPKYDSFTYGGSDYSANTFAYASRNTHNANIAVRHDLGKAGRLSVNADYHYQSQQFYDGLIQAPVSGVYPPNTLGFGGFDIVNLKASLQGVAGTGFDLSLFVKNLTNTKILPNGTPATYPTLGAGVGFYSQAPRTVGFDVRYSF